MDTMNLPPLPPANQSGPEVCAMVRLYLAVHNDLSEEQAARLHAHMASCAACSEEFDVLERATWLMGSAAATAPSARVDAAIRTLTRGGATRPQVLYRPPRAPRRRLVSLAGALVTAAVLLLALFGALHVSSIFDTTGGQSSFALPAHLSWNQYVLFHSETRMSAGGHPYEVDSYDDLGTGNMRVETKMDSQLDVIAVGNNQGTMGMDTIHHVAQMGADSWMVDDSMFDLQQLRHDLQIKEAAYLGTETFRGQSVYAIRCKDGLTLLLDMRDLPVNVLRGTGEPLYTSVQMLPASQVSASMWDMSIPPGYHMGTLPATP